MFLKEDNFRKFTTCTTRKPREGEKEGFDYYFYDKETFLKKVEQQEMFNFKEYGGNYYGSLEEDMDNIQTIKNVIFQITPDRALEMKLKNSSTCMILIIPPTAESLINRRKDRSKERIKNDIQNLEIAKKFDYVVVIIGNELCFKDGIICTNFQNNASSDPAFKGIKKMYKENKKLALELSDNIIKNTYRVLLTRGIRGCYVYCVDKQLNNYFKEKINVFVTNKH